MRRLPLLALLLLAAPAWGATYYVDAGCPTPGNGTAITCTGGASDPKNRIEDVLGSMVAGDTLNVRGIHNAHQNCTGDAAGRFFQNEYTINTACSSGSPCTIQTFNWTLPGTGERVYLDGTRCANNANGSCNAAWLQCSGTAGACNAPCNGLPASIACNTVWYVTDNGTAPTGFQSGSAANPRWAQKDDGSITYAVGSLAAMTNATAGYNNKRCSVSTWHPCDATHGNADCPGSETCTATAGEVDSFDDAGNSRLFVAWGTSLPSKPYVSYTAAGDAFAFGGSWWTVRGFVMRAHRVSSVFGNASANNLTFDDMVSIFNQDTGGGASRAFDFTATTPVTIQNSEMAYSADEGIHHIGKNAAAVALTFLKNWVHFQGRADVTGMPAGAPSGVTLGDDTADSAHADFTGTTIDGALIEWQTQNSSAGYGIRFEHSVSNATIRNTIIRSTRAVAPASNAPCIVLDGSGGTGVSPFNTDGNQVYNNLLIGCGTFGLNIYCSSSVGVGTVRNNKVYNNTIVNPFNAELNQEASSGTCTGNTFDNNILYDDGNQQVVNWVSAMNTFQNNDAFSLNRGSSTLVSWIGTAYTCATIGTLDATDKCGDPQFVSASDFHITSGSPAKDAGTSTGMPAGRTTDICNPLAINHGLPDYNNCHGIQGGTWDMGMHEFVASGGHRVLIISQWKPHLWLPKAIDGERRILP